MRIAKALEQIAYIAEVAAAVAVVVTLGYLAAQIKLNTKSNGAQSYQTWLAANLQVNAAASDEQMSRTKAEGHEDSANLSKDTCVKFGLWQMSFYQHVQPSESLPIE